MELNNLELLSLQTKQMATDTTTKAMCSTLNPKILEVVTKIKLCDIRSQIDNLDELLLDEIAFSKNIFWYDVNASIEVKKNLIRSCEKVFKYLGTNQALEQVIADYFGDGSIQEWYEYDGKPYYFKVLTTNHAITGELAEQFNRAVDAVKRKSTRLEEVLILLSANTNIFYGFVFHSEDIIRVRQEG